ncbi:MAG: DUF2474 domain-containing protein [Psychrobium sp.]
MKEVRKKQQKQWLWLAMIWGASVLSLGMVSLLLRLLMTSAGLSS